MLKWAVGCVAAGVVLVSAGAALVHPAAGLVVAGVALVAVGLLADVDRDGQVRDVRGVRR